MRLEGIYAPIPTPFKSDGSEDVCYGSLEKNMERWAATTLTGIVACGSNGELPFISTPERARITETVRATLQKAGREKKIVVGTFQQTTRETVECCKAVAEKGADATLILPPHYFKGQGMPAAIRFFETVADASPIPVVLYNMPGNTGVSIDTETILKLSHHPNIIGVKDTSGDMTQMGYLCAAQRDDFSVFCGSGNYFLQSLVVGASGGTLAVANLYPESCRMLREAYREEKMQTARDLQHRVLLASDALTRRFGVPGLKAAMERAGLYGGPVRAPMQPLGDEARGKLFAALDEADLDKNEAWR